MSLGLAVAAPVAGASGPALPVILLVVSVVPLLVLLLTSFVKISVVLSLLRSAVGASDVPPATVLTGLSLLLTFFTMAPVATRAWSAAEAAVGGRANRVRPWWEESQPAVWWKAAEAAKEPLRTFMEARTGPRERAEWSDLARRLGGTDDRAEAAGDFLVVAPAFVAAELRRAFQIGFLIFLPFLVVDLVVANFLLAFGLTALSPAAVALPFKLLLFVLADGWSLVMRGLAASYL